MHSSAVLLRLLEPMKTSHSLTTADVQGLLAAAGVFVTQDEVVSLLRHDMQLEQQRSKQ